jgi:hypothetical protein
MQIIENLISKTYQQDLINLFMYADMSWFYNAGTNYITEEQKTQITSPNIFKDSHTKECPQFSHVLCSESKITSANYASIFPILYFLEEKTGYKPSSIKRIKANFLYKDATFPLDFYNEPHTDENKELYRPMSSLLYYVNDSDGDTIFFDKQCLPNMPPIDKLEIINRYTPTQGTGILFNSHQFHASTPPRVHDRRMVINFVMYDSI